jgi:hypothetical protein
LWKERAWVSIMASRIPATTQWESSLVASVILAS